MPLAGGEELHIVSRKFLRRATCMFLALMRALRVSSDVVVVLVCLWLFCSWAAGCSLTGHGVQVDDARQGDMVRAAFREHHIESSDDFFALLQQMVYLAPGMRLVYRMDFAGMYNDVSQVSAACFVGLSVAVCSSAMTLIMSR